MSTVKLRECRDHRFVVPFWARRARVRFLVFSGLVFYSKLMRVDEYANSSSMSAVCSRSVMVTLHRSRKTRGLGFDSVPMSFFGLLTLSFFFPTLNKKK